jgi:nitric-oxide synthase
MNEQSFQRAAAERNRPRRLKKTRPSTRRSSADAKPAVLKNLFLLEQARSWLEQFHSEKECVTAFSGRWAEVRSQIRESGTYSLTAEELAYGSKVAWRNNTRCVGRLGWDSLTVRDCRHLCTAEEVFTALIEHIQQSANQGRIIPMISIFAPESCAGPKVRIWNRQLIGYAGYRQADGSIVGDPLNVYFTQYAQKLGWSGPSQGRFNLLPLVIEVDGELHWFDLPSGLVQEIAIRHPLYDWFEELDLKWFALPAVSGMRLEIGGVSFPAAPFSGWYVGSEVGARDLADVNRYNALPQIGKCLGLDIQSDRSLWKDRALIELNAAVLWSFSQARVAMADHHAVTRQFLVHEQREARAGRCVYADWSWIVPPISGGTTPVFHRKFDDRILRPNFFPQPMIWQKSSGSPCPHAH